ncbi:MAG: ECF transporter S component [Acutalibacteraceae bacterium]
MNLNQKTVRLSRLALFSALILLLNYTPLGYIRVFALEITLIIIPVTLGAMLLGPADGAVLRRRLWPDQLCHLLWFQPVRCHFAGD